MKIETKYDLDDKVWTIDNNKVVCFVIKCVQFLTSNFSDIPAKSIVYSGEHTEAPHREEDCYPTKEELINSIK